MAKPQRNPTSALSRFEPIAARELELPVLKLARQLIGAIIVHQLEEGLVAGRIVETEAYRGPADLAAHSRRGLRTQRTEVMFGPAGHAYVFLLYGTSWAFNVVAGKTDEPHAVLVRAVEPVTGEALMATRRRRQVGDRNLTNGPGKLSQALGIQGAHGGTYLTTTPGALHGPAADHRVGTLFLARGKAGPVGRSPRINVDYAGTWALRPWRFFERGNRYVSAFPR